MDSSFIKKYDHISRQAQRVQVVQEIIPLKILGDETEKGLEMDRKWQELSSSNLCYISRLEGTEMKDRKWKSCISLSPITRWV